jgi:hypothetical protein
MIRLPKLDIHVAHGCNLKCEDCHHFSNYHFGLVSLKELEGWSRAWNHRILPTHLMLVGGEPALNPDLPGFIRRAKSFWPHSNLVLWTNGLLLDRHPDLTGALRETRASVVISIHDETPEYRAAIEKASATFSQSDIPHSFCASHDRWLRIHRYRDGKTVPHGQNPRESWMVCEQRDCLQLFEGKLWKCAKIAYLKLIKNLSDDWRPYLNYRPLFPSCTEEELLDFVKKAEEACCGMCHSVVEHFKPHPFHAIRPNAAKSVPAEPRIERP